MMEGYNEVNWSLQLRRSCHFWIQSVLLPVVVVVGVVGNLITIVVLTRRRMSCSTNTYLTALALSDILLLLFYLVLSFENNPHLRHPDYLPYWTLWRFSLWFADASNGVSIWLTVSFTVERYIAVCHPLRGRVLCTESRARKVIVFFFIVCPLVTITTPFEWVIQVGTSHDNSTSMVVRGDSILGKNKTYKTVFYWFWAVMFVFVPLIILTILNSFLINAVRKSTIHRSSLTQSQRHMRSGAQREAQENKMTMTLVAVVFLFLVCQTPTAATLIITIFYIPAEMTVGGNLLGALNTVWNFLVALNAASNFLLYCVMSDKYRRTLVLTFFPSVGARHYRADTVTSANSSSLRLPSIRSTDPR